MIAVRRCNLLCLMIVSFLLLRGENPPDLQHACRALRPPIAVRGLKSLPPPVFLAGWYRWRMHKEKSMKKVLSALALILGFGLVSLDADAARRFGGGGNVGKQRATPTQKEATPAQPASPAPNQAAPAAAPAAAG